MYITAMTNALFLYLWTPFLILSSIMTIISIFQETATTLKSLASVWYCSLFIRQCYIHHCQ